nr:reverse transcriptase domain-containing protein [Tanacetum cinerariifolium]
MVKEGIVLSYKVFGSGIEVDKAEIESISKLPYPTTIKAIQTFLVHAGKDFSQIARLMTQLLVKYAPFNFSKECIQAFDKLKQELKQTLIMIKPDWSLTIEIMCNANDYDVRAVLGQMKDTHFQPIHYSSKKFFRSLPQKPREDAEAMQGNQPCFKLGEMSFHECIQAFDKLKQELKQTLIMIKPDWSLTIEIMCNANDYDVRAVLGQMKDKHFQPIHYSSKVMKEALEN